MTGELLSNIHVVLQENLYLVYSAVPQRLLFSSMSAHDAVVFAVACLNEKGGEIALGPGEFIVDSAIQLANHIWLHGSGRGTRLRVGFENTEGFGIMCTGLVGVEISNLSVTGQDNPQAIAGIVMDGCGDCTIHDVLCCSFMGYGIWVRNETMMSVIRGCSLAGNAKANIFFDKHRRGKYGDFIPNLITNCRIYGGGKGIDCLETTVLNIVACIIYQTRDIAIHVRDVSYSVLVSGCRTFQIGSHAVVVENAGEFNLSSNILCWHTGHGLVVSNSGWGAVVGNEIIDSGSYNANVKDFSTKISEVPSEIPLHNGISLYNARGFNVTGNTIFNWPQARKLHVGIFEDNACRKNSFTANNINYFEKAGIESLGTGTTVENNTVDAAHPHDGNPDEVYHQSFQTDLTDLFIDNVL